MRSPVPVLIVVALGLTVFLSATTPNQGPGLRRPHRMRAAAFARYLSLVEPRSAAGRIDAALRDRALGFRLSASSTGTGTGDPTPAPAPTTAGSSAGTSGTSSGTTATTSGTSSGTTATTTGPPPRRAARPPGAVRPNPRPSGPLALALARPDDVGRLFRRQRGFEQRRQLGE